MSNFVRHVCHAMEKIAPLRLAEKWDNVGLLLEAPPSINRPPKKVLLLTIDLTSAVCKEAIEKRASMIVAYHPPLFSAVKSVTMANPLQASLLRCVANGISVYSPHTALDSVWGGLNDWLATGLLEPSLSPSTATQKDGKISALGEAESGIERNTTVGSSGGRLVSFRNPITIEQVISRAKRHLNIKYVQVARCAWPSYLSAGDTMKKGPEEDGEIFISSVAVCAGSGGSVLGGVDADVYLTGEMDHHTILAAVAAGKHVILCGHTNTERGYLPTLRERLEQELQPVQDDGASGTVSVEIVVSEQDRHPLVSL